MLYTHLGGVLFLGAEAALLGRDRWRGRPIVAGCLGLALALLLFAPIAPMALGQLHASAVGHRFDWIGSANHSAVTIKIGGALAASMVGLSVVFGRSLSFDYAGANPLDDSEPVRWCAIWTMLPVLALMAGSVVLHPMFQIRYIAPVIAGFAILAAAIFGAGGTKVGNLGAVAVASAFVVLAILFQLYHPPFELWRRIAREVSAAKSPSQQIFFEAGYVIGIRQAAGLNPASMIEVLPDGYLRIPFDYYFAGSNPRLAINPSRPILAREAIARSARRSGGAWVVSHMNDEDLEAELPSRDTFARDRVIYDASVSVSLYHIIPRDEHR
jgi:hypothetical protein